MATFIGTLADEFITPELVSTTVVSSGGPAPSGLADLIIAGGGNDTVAAGRGADSVDLGAGDDRFLWNSGDGSDAVAGSAGYDTLAVRGSDAAEAVTIRQDDGGARFFRNIGNADIGLTAVERIEYAALGGEDFIVVDSLGGSGVAAVVLNLAGAIAGTGDGDRDTIVARGSADGDTIVIALSGDGLVSVKGLAAEISIGNSDGLSDDLIVDGGNGNDAIDTTGFSAGILGLTLRGGQGADVLIGGSASETFEGGIGGDLVLGGAGIDAASYAGSTAGVSVNLATSLGSGGEAAGDQLFDIENLFGSAHADNLTGTSADNTFAPGAGADTVYGGGGSDTVSYAGSNARVSVYLAEERAYGGHGDGDRLVGIENIVGSAYGDHLVGNAFDNLIEGGAGRDDVYGGAGNDTASYAASGAGVALNLEAGIGYGGAGIGGHAEGDLLSGIENLIGSGFADSLAGDAGANRLDGGAGADTLSGRGGNDTYVVDNAGDVVIESADGGHDTVRSSVSYRLGAHIEDAVLAGSQKIDIIGNDLANAIAGNGGSNRIDGGGGSDRMTGGAGDDIYVVDSVGDSVGEDRGAGTDTVWSSVTHKLAANVENLILTGAAAGGVGNELVNRIIGNGADNRIDGGKGIDVMAGGGGNDVYLADSGSDRVVEKAGEGIDTVLAFADHILAEHVENLELSSKDAVKGVGNDLANVITGTVLGNIIDGGRGHDRMAGGDGNDFYVVDAAGDVVVERAGEGSDTVRATVGHTLAANIENLTITGESAVDGTGNGLANVLRGNAAANRLDGGGGADIMVGGAGNDRYIVDQAGDRIAEQPDAGVDMVRSTVSWTLGADLEKLVLAGNAAIDGTGNGVANAIAGNAATNLLSGGGGDDWLDGAGGADTMIGGNGNDTYIVDNPGDVVSESAQGGIDTVVSSVAIVLGAEIEHLRLVGGVNAAADASGSKATGNALVNKIAGSAAADLIDGAGGNDVLTGRGGKDRLIGGAGDDTLSGGRGDDVLIGGKGGDRFLFDTALSGSGADRIIDFALGKDRILLDGALYGDLTEGKLDKQAFGHGKTAADGGDRVIYDKARGMLYVDADGKGGEKAILFARVENSLDLSHEDFLVV